MANFFSTSVHLVRFSSTFSLPREEFVDHEYLRILAKYSADKPRPQLIQSLISMLRIWRSVSVLAISPFIETEA